MAWSTPQLAGLASTTVKAVRYYHRIGLLPEPDRTTAGRKLYDAGHLARLLEIRRLAELGLSPARIAAAGGDGEASAEAVRGVDAELAATIERLGRLRDELAETVRHGAPAHLPPSFAPLAAGFTDRQRALLMIYASVLSEESLARFRSQLEDPDPIEVELEELPADAGDTAIDDLVTRMVPVLRRRRAESPWSADPTADAPGGSAHALRVMGHAVAQLYNPAQLAVLQAVHRRLAADPSA